MLGYLVLSCGSEKPAAPVDWDYDSPLGYVACKTEKPLIIDGLPDKAWDNAPWSGTFNDIEGDKKPKPRFQSRMKMLWNEQYLYVYAEMEEPHICGYLTTRDTVICLENDFEMFIKPSALNPQYGEFEMNALGTTWDLFLMRPYRSNANVMNSWDIRELISAVHLNGTINNPNDTDKEWSVELSIPWKVLKDLGRYGPLRDGDIWRINFSRVEYQNDISPEGKYIRKAGVREDNWTWSPQGTINMHKPECFGYVQLSEKLHGTMEFKTPEEEPVLQTLFHLLTAKQNNMKAKSIKELIGSDKIRVKGITMQAELQPNPYGFYIFLTNIDNGAKYVIDEREVIIKL